MANSVAVGSTGAEGVLLNTSIRVLVVDDYEPWHRFVVTTLRNEPELEIVGKVSDGLEAVNKAQELQPDLILLDIGLPTLNGIEAARRIREVSPTSKILFVSQNRSWDIAKEALRSGGDGYVVKSKAASELLPAVEAVLQDKPFVSPEVTAEQSLGIFRVDMDRPMPVDLPEEEQIRRILHDSFIADCNEAEAKMYGLNSAKDLIGRRMAEMVTPDDPKNIELTRQFIRSGYKVLHRKSYEVDAQGNPKVFLNSMTGVIINGRLTTTLGEQSDITTPHARSSGDQHGYHPAAF